MTRITILAAILLLAGCSNEVIKLDASRWTCTKTYVTYVRSGGYFMNIGKYNLMWIPATINEETECAQWTLKP